MTSKNNNQAAFQLLASVVVAGIIVIGISTLAGYLPTPGLPGSGSSTSQQQSQVITSCGSTGSCTLVTTTTTASSGGGGTTTTTASGSGTTTTTTTASGSISGFNIQGSPSLSFRDVVLSNGPVLLMVAGAAGLVGLIIREKRKP